MTDTTNADTDYDDASGYQSSNLLKRSMVGANSQVSQDRANQLKSIAQQTAAANTARASQDSEQQSAADSSSEESYSAQAAKQASEAPLTRASSYLSGQNYVNPGYPKGTSS